MLAAKLAAPASPGPVVVRARLLRRLDGAVRGPVTLVSAPAGWGKTTLLSTWARKGQQMPLGWLAVESGDEGARFWAYLHAALDPLAEGLPAPPDPMEDGYLIRLADALARLHQPITLVLDDLHRIDDAAVFRDLDFLLRHVDNRLRLVIGSRTDPALPLHRWRLSGDLTEIGTEELSFTPAEAAELLTGHGLTLPAEHVWELHARTEGWAAGLRLAALSLNGHPDPARFVKGFAGDHPDVAAYLDAEVLAGLTADARNALASASIAPQLCDGLLNAVTGRTDGKQLLDEAARLGFVRQLAARPASYRCHRLLTDLLRAELSRQRPDEIPDLHRRAAAWHLAHSQPAQALRHALAAGEWGQATDVLRSHWCEIVTHRHGDTGDVPALPPAEVVRAGPELALACAAERLSCGDGRVADRYLDLATQQERQLVGERRHRFALMLAAFRLGRALSGGDSSKIHAAARELTAAVPPVGSDFGARALARAALGTVGLATGDLAAADSELSGAVRDAERAGLSRVVQMSTNRLALVKALRGELRAAEELAAAALAASSNLDGAERTHARLALATVAIQRDLPDDAEANLLLAANEPTGEPGVAALAELLRAHLLRDRDDLAGSHRALRAGRESAERAAARRLTHEFVVCEASLCLARGDTSRALRLMLPLVEKEPAAPYAVALARVHLCAGDPRAAARAVPDWDSPESASWPLVVRLEAGLLDAVSARRLGDHRRATRALERVLQLAEPEGHRRVFTRADPPVRELLAAHLDSGTAYWSLVNDLLAACPAESRPVPAAPGEPLTDRELTVLRYLQSILSNVEIASELSLSVNTVKTHVRNIYRKLDATRRRDAVRRARELHLI